MRAEKVSIGAFQPGDLDGVLRLLNRTLNADPMSSEVFQRKVVLDINFHPDGAPVARSGDEVVGFMLGLVRKYPLEDGAPDFDRGWITLMAVEPRLQRQRIGSRLLQHLLDYFQASNRTSVWVSPYAPNYFSPGIDEAAYPGAIEFLKKHGFQVAYRPLSMDALLLNLETPEWVKEKEARLIEDGMVFDTFKPEYILPLLDHLRREFPGDWQRYERESMVRITQGTFPPDQLFVAMENRKCVGFCQHDGERFGPFGVDLAERSRGIGAVLLFRCLHSMRSKDLHSAWFLWTNDHVAKLYAQAGFKETRRYSVMKREL